MDLTPYIEVHTSEVLNATGTLDDVFLRRPEDPEFKEPKGIASDCDPQLLFTLQFKETIKIAAIKFICPSARMSAFFCFATLHNLFPASFNACLPFFPQNLLRST